ncbi:MAG: prolipoprotein diacylglyceryl transferase [Acidimicrobiales bacterium]
MLSAIAYDPILRIGFGPLSVSPHGLGIAAGFLIGARLMMPTARAKGIDEQVVYALLTRAAIGSIIGARLAYVVNHLGDYQSVREVLSVWEGGISLLGGMFGAVIMAMPLMRKSRISFWKMMDSAAPGLALGVVVGRIGDIVIADHLGTVTNFFLGYRCPPLEVATGSPCAPTATAIRTVGAVVHQTALYDQILAAILLVVLLRLRRQPRFDGFLICVFAGGYGAARVVEDFLREDLRHFGLTASQWTALITLSVCLWVLVVKRQSPKWGHWDRLPVAVAVDSGAGAVALVDPVSVPPTGLEESAPGSSSFGGHPPVPDSSAPANPSPVPSRTEQSD